MVLYTINSTKGYTMKKYTDKQITDASEKLLNDVDKSLKKINDLVSKFEEKFDVDISNDLHYKLDEVADMIQDNITDADFDNND